MRVLVLGVLVSEEWGTWLAASWVCRTGARNFLWVDREYVSKTCWSRYWLPLRIMWSVRRSEFKFAFDIAGDAFFFLEMHFLLRDKPKKKYKHCRKCLLIHSLRVLQVDNHTSYLEFHAEVLMKFTKLHGLVTSEEPDPIIRDS